MGVATDLSGRLIKFCYKYDISSDFTEMEIISGRVVARAAQVGHYLPIGRIVANTITHGIIAECEIQAVLLMRDLPWDSVTNTLTSTGVSDLISKKLSVNTTVPYVAIQINRGGTSTDDSYYDEQNYLFVSPVITQFEHAFDTATHQVVNISFVADGSYFEPNVNYSA